MSLLLHISDTHFGTEKPEVVKALLELAHAQRPGVIVLSGDITQRATRTQFTAAARFVAQLPRTPLVAIPGNHDIPLFNVLARLFNPYGHHCRVFGPELEPVFESDRWLVQAVNTTRRWRHADGEVSLEQVDRVTQRLLHARPGQLRVVVTHQPVAVTLPQDETNLLHGRAHAVQCWSDAGADLILGGHIHLPFVEALRPHFAAIPRNLWAVQAGTAVSARTRSEAPNSVNLIRHSGTAPRAAVVERWDHNAQTGRFEPVASTPIQPSPDDATQHRF